MNLLVVDDDSVVRMSMRTLLTAEGHTVCTAADGEDALAKLASHSFDMIISDVYMPNMDGIRLRNIVREMPEKRQMRFLFMSGYDDQSTLEMIKSPRLKASSRKGVRSRSCFPGSRTSPRLTISEQVFRRHWADTRAHRNSRKGGITGAAQECH